MTHTDKPPYRVPLMPEITALPWNGLKVVSTFSGCGGSCLGYRMAGFRIVWANEFVPAARESYKANSQADCILDERDIRQVKPEEILEATGLQQGELDLLDGSPPCASFSTAGKREAGWGKVKIYSDTKQRTDDLFFEYVRILRGLQPKVFVAENVSGLVKGTAKGYFLEILRELKASGYRVACKVLDAQWLGVPQMRQRTIFIGVREDLGLEPVHPKPLAYRYSVRDALSMQVIHDESGKWSKGDITEQPAPAVRAQRRGTMMVLGVIGKEVEVETDISRYAIGREWEKVKVGGKSEKYLNLCKPGLDSPCNCITAPAGMTSAATVVHPLEKRRFSIAELKRICAFPDDFILCGSYAQQWERLGRSVPPVMMFRIASVIRDEILGRINT